VVKLADTPTRLVGAGYEIGNGVWVDHKPAILSSTESQHGRFESSQYSKNTPIPNWNTSDVGIVTGIFDIALDTKEICYGL
jgi:hypothetical protein